MLDIFELMFFASAFVVADERCSGIDAFGKMRSLLADEDGSRWIVVLSYI